MKFLKRPFHFEWDKGNKDKSLTKHRVTNVECEEVFFDPHKRLIGHTLYSGKEMRYLLIGGTKRYRTLFLVFTIRKDKVRVISARALSRKERRRFL